MSINTEYLIKCISTLEKSYFLLKKEEKGSIDYEIYRNSLIKSFEITLEQAGKLLKKRLTEYFATNRIVDTMNFKDIFRNAHKHFLISEEELERWFSYSDNRNNTAHDYGEAFVEETLLLIDTFLSDVKNLEKVIKNERTTD